MYIINCSNVLEKKHRDVLMKFVPRVFINTDDMMSDVLSTSMHQIK